MAGLKVVFGGASITPGSAFYKPEDIEAVYKALEDGGCDEIDTATAYGQSEQTLSESGAPKRFKIDTKTPGGMIPGLETKENIIADAEKSHKLLGPINVYYLHSPSYTYPLEKILEGVNEVYNKGYFKYFGLSNYKPEDVQRVYDLSKAKGWVLPTYYQGNYNAAARGQEEQLFPTLRKLGIAFYAYSPLAGGFLTKNKEEILSGQGRFDPESRYGQMYNRLYNRPSLMEALSQWQSIAEDEGVTRGELAYRWLSYNSPLSSSHGDAIVIGASKLSQVTGSLANLKKGPLSDKAVKRIDEMWETIKHEAPVDNVHA